MNAIRKPRTYDEFVITNADSTMFLGVLDQGLNCWVISPIFDEITLIDDQRYLVRLGHQHGIFNRATRNWDVPVKVASVRVTRSGAYRVRYHVNGVEEVYVPQV